MVLGLICIVSGVWLHGLGLFLVVKSANGASYLGLRQENGLHGFGVVVTFGWVLPYVFDMKKVKVLMLGGKAVGVVDGGCELVEVPVVGGVQVAVDGGDSRVVDYKAEVKAYVNSVPEGGLLIPGWSKVIEEDVVVRACDNGDYGMTLYFDDGRDDHGEDWYAVYTFLRLDLRKSL